MKRLLALVSLVFLESQALLAETAEHGGEAHGGAHHEASLAWPWINFAIYVIGLYFILRKPLSGMWHNRRDTLMSLRERGALELRNAQGLLVEAERRIANVEPEAVHLERSIIADGEREGQQLVAEAKSRAERISKQLDESISSELRGAEVALRRELADKVLATAADRLRKELNADSDRSIRQQVLGGVRGLVQ